MVGFSKRRPAKSSIGIFGKIPARGDFISYGLPRSFQDSCAAWIRDGFVKAQESPNWHEQYFSSPIWQFAASRGFFDAQAWCGIIMPSVDSVGRNFPLIIAMQADAVRSDVLLAAQRLAQDTLQRDFGDVTQWQNEVMDLANIDITDGPTRVCSPPTGAYFQALGYDGELMTKLHELKAAPQIFANLIGANATPLSSSDGDLL